MSDADDRRLLQAIAAHDRAAFESFFRTHGSSVHRFVRDLVRDDGLAEELTSDVMVQVWRSAGKYAGRSRARTWLFGIAHHKAIDALRRRRAATVPPALDDASPRTSGAVHGATLVVEIPPDRLDGTLDALATLGTVQNRRIDAEDVDNQIVDEEARLRNMRREESDLRRLMDKGGKVDEILTVQQNLSDVRGRIEQLDAQHQHDLRRVTASTITVVLTEDRPTGAPAKPGPTARIDGAWHAGLDALADTVVAFVSGLAWCVAYSPIALALCAGLYVARRMLSARATLV